MERALRPASASPGVALGRCSDSFRVSSSPHRWALGVSSDVQKAHTMPSAPLQPACGTFRDSPEGSLQKGATYPPGLKVQDTTVQETPVLT